MTVQESALGQYPGVREAVVTCPVPGAGRLVAYVVADPRPLKLDDRRELADTIARAVSMDATAIEQAFAGPAPENDDELVALCRELEIVAERIEGVG